MRKRIEHEQSTAVDTLLRRISRRYPEALLRLFDIQEHAQISGWVDTQISARQRRLDRALGVVVDGTNQQLHVEWTERWTRRVEERVFEYNHLISDAARVDVYATRKKGQRAPRPPPVDSAVVVLTGRKEKWPEYGEHRTSSDTGKFSGVQFRFEAIYQKTVAEMEAMGSVFWLVFVPVAVDVDQDKLLRVIDTLKRSTTSEDYGDLIATMLEIAYMKKDRPELAKVILSHGRRDAIMFGSVWQEAKREGKLELMLGLFERRVGRPLSARERHRIGTRLNKLGATVLSNVVCDLSREQLVAWLAPNGHRAARSMR